MSDLYSPPLQVLAFISTQRHDAERGPEVRMRSAEAGIRLLFDGELVWVKGPRRSEVAALKVDDAIPRGGVVVRDIAGLAPSEVIRVVKVNTDRPPLRGHFA